MNKDIEKFYEKLKSDKELTEEIINKRKYYSDNLSEKDSKSFLQKKIIPIAKKEGFNFTLDELLEYDKNNKVLLNDKDLSEVSGGANKLLILGLSSFAMFGSIAFMNLNNTFATATDVTADATATRQISKFNVAARRSTATTTASRSTFASSVFSRNENSKIVLPTAINNGNEVIDVRRMMTTDDWAKLVKSAKTKDVRIITSKGELTICIPKTTQIGGDSLFSFFCLDEIFEKLQSTDTISVSDLTMIDRYEEKVVKEKISDIIRNRMEEKKISPDIKNKWFCWFIHNAQMKVSCNGISFLQPNGTLVSYKAKEQAREKKAEEVKKKAETTVATKSETAPSAVASATQTAAKSATAPSAVVASTTQTAAKPATPTPAVSSQQSKVSQLSKSLNIPVGQRPASTSQQQKTEQSSAVSATEKKEENVSNLGATDLHKERAKNPNKRLPTKYQGQTTTKSDATEVESSKSSSSSTSTPAQQSKN